VLNKKSVVYKRKIQLKQEDSFDINPEESEVFNFLTPGAHHQRVKTQDYIEEDQQIWQLGEHHKVANVKHGIKHI